MSLTGSQNPRLILGKPQRRPTGLSKPTASTSLVQHSLNPRFTLGEPSFLLSSISLGTQGTQGSPLKIFPIPNFYLCRNSSLQEYKKSKARPWYQKPKVYPWYTLLQNSRLLLSLLTHSNYEDHSLRSKFHRSR